MSPLLANDFELRRVRSRRRARIASVFCGDVPPAGQSPAPAASRRGELQRRCFLLLRFARPPPRGERNENFRTSVCRMCAEPVTQLEGIFLARPETPGEGIPLAVKDLFDTAGLVTTYGSILFDEHVPTETAEAVQRLEAAGYADVGKTNLHEFAYGTTSENPHFGTVPNPLAPGRIAGGSSGGSAAALAAGLAEAALGTDSGGSIRIPAACCGVVGFKPSYGLVPMLGLLPARAELRPRGADGPRRRGLRRDDGGAGSGLRACGARARGRRGRSRLARARRPKVPRAGRGRRGAVSTHAQPRPAPRPQVRRGLHGRSGGRAPRALPRARRVVRRERPHEGRALPRAERCRVRVLGSRAGALPRAVPAGRGGRRPGAHAHARLRRSACSHRRARDSPSADLSDAPLQRHRLAGARASLRSRRATGCPPPSSWPPRRARMPESWPPAPRSSGRCHSVDVTRTSDCARRAGADNFC